MFFAKTLPIPPTLSEWHKLQAAMLYSFASVDKLKNLHQLVCRFIDSAVNASLDLAEQQDRDSFLNDPRWGTRDTAKNWANNAWPFLKDLQSSLVGDIAKRLGGKYKITSTSDKVRGASEFSLRWTTPSEEQTFNAAIERIYNYGSMIDRTLSVSFGDEWDDFGLALAALDFRSESSEIPKFRIRTDIIEESGLAPTRPGVYISKDDTNATLQFAWPGDGKLRPPQRLIQLAQMP